MKDRRAFWAGFLAALLLARALRALLSTLFYESLASLRLNESAFWMLALGGAAVAPFLAPRIARVAIGLAGIATAALPLARFTPQYVPLAAVASGLGLAGLFALARAGSTAIAGALAGLAVDLGIMTLGASLDPLPPIVVLGAAIGAFFFASDLPATTPAKKGIAAGSALGALLAVEIAFLASPYAVARWAGIPAWGAALASGLGLILGATRLRHAGALLTIAGSVALIDVALVQSPIVALSIAILQAALGAAAARIAPALGGKAAAIAFTLVFAPIAFVLLFFRSPLGISEWGAIVPALSLAPIAVALFHERPERMPRAHGAMVAVALLGLLLIPAVLPAPLTPPHEDDTIRLVSWNVHQGFGNRGALDPEIYRDALLALDADIIVLQESDTARLSSGGLDVPKYLAAELGMRAAYGRSGVAILSRFPLGDAPRPPEADWTFEAPIQVGNATLWIHGVHLARGRFPEERVEQAEALVNDTHGPHHIIAGDLNSCPTPTCFGGARSTIVYDALVARYQDAWVAAGHDREDPAGNTHPAWGPSRRIDHVLIEGIEVLSAGPVRNELTRDASDHLPMLVVLRLA